MSAISIPPPSTRAPADRSDGSGPVSVREARQAGEILAAVDISLPAVEAPTGYGLAMGTLALFLVLLPLAYVTLAAFLGWLVAWHVLQTFVSLERGPYFVFHIPMALLGGLLLLFLVKPIFFRLKGEEQDVITLQPEEEPLLFEFVRRLCLATGTQMPTKIEVDCDPNASARVRGGIMGLFGGHLVLRIGLPLVAGMNVRQFAGVLGHEFGHFNQRGGMTGSYLIRRLTHFFAAVVFQRDRLDERLIRMRHASGILPQLMYWIAVALIEPMRGVLWLMLLIGELLTGSVLRRMEYDADEVEAHVAGVRDFIRTSKLLVFLSIAAQRARRDLADALERKQLADDLPSLIYTNAAQLAEHRDDILKIIEAQTTDWFDTHPCHSDRIRSVEQLGAAGEVKCAIAARALFSSFPALCRRSTEAFYREALGEARWVEVRAKSRLVPTAEIASDRAEQRQSAKILHKYFREQIAMTRPIFPLPDAVLPAKDLEGEAQALMFARQATLDASAVMGGAVEQFESAASTLPVARAQIALCSVFPFTPKVQAVHRQAQNLRAKHEPVLLETSRQIAAFEDPARRRLTHAMRLVQRDEVIAKLPVQRDAKGKRIPTPDPRLQAQWFVELSQSLHAVLPRILHLREEGMTLGAMMSAYDAANPYQPLVQQVLAVNGRILEQLHFIQNELGVIPYPFAHGTKDITLGAALVESLPPHDDPAAVDAAAGAAFDQYFTFTFRVLATLTKLAEDVETALGLDPLPEPPETESVNDAREKAEEKRNSRKYWLGYSARAVVGMGLVALIVMLSLSPPNLPTMPWERAGASRERGRPSSFNGSVRNYSEYRPTAPAYNHGDPYRTGNPYPPGGPYSLGNPYSPGNPNYPGRAPAAPSHPGYQPPQRPTYQPPQPYRPPTPGGGGYSPGRGSGGGGGISPGGGGGRR